MLNIVLFGPPGAGKGTQSEKLINKYGLVHLSTGDIFRANIKGGTELGTLAKSYIDKGQLVPDEVTIGMLASEVNKNPNAKGFIFDGFPRTVPQAEALDQFLKSRHTTIHAVVQLDVNQEELKKRLAERKRPDDEEKKVIKRMDEYFNKTIHVLPYYEAQNKLAKVNGIGEVNTIFDQLCEKIDLLNKSHKN